MVNNDPDDQHCSPGIRLCDVTRPANGSCGFHLTRSKWDPYPWVNGVENGSAAEAAGLQPGDCVLEVNGEDVLGQKITEVASRVRASEDHFTLLVWNAGSDPQCSPESLCCGPMPSNLQRLSACMNSILAVLECPICLDTIPPPAHQCGNGHLICVKCRVKTERCPICRVRFCRARSLLADQVFNSLTEAFGLKDEAEDVKPAKLRERLFGSKKNKQTTPSRETPDIKLNLVSSPTNKFLTRLLGKSSSVENLSVHHCATSRYLSAIIDSEFSSNLKAKSLSTSEICHPIGSRPISRTSSINLSHRRLDVPIRRSASYNGSSNSLNADFNENFQLKDRLLYHCPCKQNCTNLVEVQKVFSHIEEAHEGPLIHCFKSKITLNLPPAFEDTAVITLTHKGITFILKIIHQDNDYCDPGDTLIWLWIVGSDEEAGNYCLHIKLIGLDDQAKEMNFQTSVLSMASTSWTDICRNHSAICFTAAFLLEQFSLDLETGFTVKMEVEVEDRQNGHQTS